VDFFVLGKISLEKGESSRAFGRCCCANPLNKIRRSISKEQGPSAPF
jgi:hypothetical protein